jgi:predicted small integral membrane protein
VRRLAEVMLTVAHLARTLSGSTVTAYRSNFAWVKHLLWEICTELINVEMLYDFVKNIRVAEFLVASYTLQRHKQGRKR